MSRPTEVSWDAGGRHVVSTVEELEMHWRHTIPAELAREATRTFLLTGRLDDRVTWSEA